MRARGRCVWHRKNGVHCWPPWCLRLARFADAYAKACVGREEKTLRLNLTNGSVLVDEADRNRRLQTSDPIHITFPESDIRLDCTCEGYTLSGPVIQVRLEDLSTHRDTFIARWQP